MRFEPRNDQVLVRLDPRETRTASGLTVPASAQRNGHLLVGTAVRTGPGAFATSGQLIPMNTKEGDRVVAVANNGEIPIDLGTPDQHVIIGDANFLGVLYLEDET
jgi:co-chaperonin GroES (HSP10)